jgi:hypothetical protein
MSQISRARRPRIYLKGVRGGSACRPATERRSWLTDQLRSHRRVSLDAYRSATGASRAAIFRDFSHLEPTVRDRVQADRRYKSEWILIG